MALCRAVDLTLKSVRPILVNPCFIVPSSANLQVRHAARKGYREKVKQQKKLEKQQLAAVTKELTKVRQKFIKIEKTINLKKPEPPDDDVFIKDNFNYKKYSLPEVINFHKEYHHPTVHNNPNAPIFVRIEIDMTGKRKTQFIKPFSGIASIPHPFTLKNTKEILVLCEPERKELALSCGASVAGGSDVIKKIQEGVIQISMFDYIISPVSFLPQLTPIRHLFKDKAPKAKVGTLTNDLESAIYRFLHGIEYSCLRYGASNDFGVIHCSIGTIGMEAEHIDNNFKALVKDIETNRPPRDGEFITWVWCLSPPSSEEFCIDLSDYVTTITADEDDEGTELTEKEAIRIATRKLKQELEEKL